MEGFSRLSPFEALLARALCSIIDKLHKTVIIEVIDTDDIQRRIRQGISLVFAGWHGDMLASLGTYRRLFQESFNRLLIIRDDPRGRILATATQRLGFHPICIGNDPGSGTWTRGILRMNRLLRTANAHALIAMDGPEGPARKIQPGIEWIARKAHVPIVPTAVAMKPSIRVHWRWDNLLIPLPRSRLVVVFGMPILPDTIACTFPEEVLDVLAQRMIATTTLAQNNLVRSTHRS